jgi:1,4-alpha-glucan branching enzyme
VVSWLRLARNGSFVAVVCNFTPIPRHGYRIGVPAAGDYEEVVNSDSRHYGGGDLGNSGLLSAGNRPWMGRPASLELTVPPLAVVVLAPVRR